MAFSEANGFSEYLGAQKQRIQWAKTGSVTTVALVPFSVFDQAGMPGAGTLAGSSTNGVKPTDATTGFPTISAFGSGNLGYLTKVEYYSSVASRIDVFDMLFKAGTYGFASGTTNLTGQPSIQNRCPDDDGVSSWGLGNEIWVEVSTAFATGNNWTVQVTYTRNDGTTGRTSQSVNFTAASALTQRKMFQIPLAAGDAGVQKIESVIVTNGGTAMTAGAFNVLILRRLWSNRVPLANGGGINNIFDTGAPRVYEDSALFGMITADSTSSGLPNLILEITNV